MMDFRVKPFGGVSGFSIFCESIPDGNILLDILIGEGRRQHIKVSAEGGNRGAVVGHLADVFY